METTSGARRQRLARSSGAAPVVARVECLQVEEERSAWREQAVPLRCREPPRPSVRGSSLGSGPCIHHAAEVVRTGDL